MRVKYYRSSRCEVLNIKHLLVKLVMLFFALVGEDKCVPRTAVCAWNVVRQSGSGAQVEPRATPRTTLCALMRLQNVHTVTDYSADSKQGCFLGESGRTSGSVKTHTISLKPFVFLLFEIVSRTIP